VQLGATMALGRLLTPSQFGIMGAASVVVVLSQIVSRIGVGPAIIQRSELSESHLRAAITQSCSLGILLGSVVWFGAPALARFYRIPEVEPVLRPLAFMFPLDGLNTVAKSLLIRRLRFRRFVAMDVGSYILGYAVVAVVLAYLGYGVWALVIANLTQVALRTVAMYLAARHPLRPSFNLRASRDLLSFGVGHSMAQVGKLVSQQGDNMVVGRWLGPAPLGIYGRAFFLMVMPASAFGRIVNRILFPVMARVQEDRDRLANAYERAVALVALISLPLSSVFWVIAPEFIRVILGPAWDGVVAPFRMFGISLLFRMSSSISDASITAAGEVYYRALLQWVFAGLVVLGAIAGKHWGVSGVAVGVSIAMAFNWLSMAYLNRVVTGAPWSTFAKAHVPALALAALTGGVVAVVAEAARSMHLGSIPTLIAAGAAALAATYLAARVWPRLFLGKHGSWAFRYVEDLRRRLPRVASAEVKANPQ
jgi:O-antigen/teichoic acid export membrane protein